MGTSSDDFEFAKWGLDNKQFKWNASKFAAAFLVARADAVWSGAQNVVAHINGHDLLATDIYELLRLSEPEAWSFYCSILEERDEWQSRIDNAKGKSY